MAGYSVVETFVSELILLLENTTFNCDKKAQNIISSIASSFKTEQNISELELALSILFRQKNSLLYFIEKAAGNRSFKISVKDALNCINDPIFLKCKENISQYVVPIKDVCYKCLLEKNSSADVKSTAYKVITEIIKGSVQPPADADLKIAELVNFLHRELAAKTNSTSQNVVQGILELYGAIAAHEVHCRAICPNKIDSLIRSILSELKTQIETTSDIKTHRITGCMVALNGILVNFTRSYEEAPTENQQIYGYIKKACDHQPILSRRTFQRAALELFATHVNQFWHWVLEDFRYWLNLLPIWASSNNVDDRRAGMRSLEKFHEVALKHLATHPQDPSSTALMRTLWAEYKAIFNNPQSSDIQLSLAIRGVGALASCGSHLSQDVVSTMFTTVLHWAQNNFNREDDSGNCQQLADCVQSLSHMCRSLETVGNEQLAALLRLVQLAVQDFPQLPANKQYIAVQALIRAIFNMALCKPAIVERFLYPLVYEAVVQSCSHSLVEEAELQRELTGQRVITYQDYLPMWKLLLKLIRKKFGPSVTGVTMELKVNLAGKLYNCLLRALIDILKKLDVKYTKQYTEENELRSDPECSMQGSKPQDHSILCNLVNLYKDLMRALDTYVLEEWLPQLIPVLLRRSAELPLVSAFYKLLATALHIADRIDYFRAERQASLGKQVVSFLEDLMFRCQQYKNDLQASCLLAVVSVPVYLIEPLLAHISSVVKTLMQLGQSYLVLAHSGMDALVRWQRKLPPDQLKAILQDILPSFDPYLRSSGILTESTDEEVRLSKKQEQRTKRVAVSSELNRLQERILGLLSQLDSATCLSLLRQEVSAVAWTAQPTLTIKLPCPDQRPNICLDPLLPRVVELAVTSSDRQTKAAACEVLHAIVIIFTGLAVTQESTQAVSLASLLHRLLPSVLRLSCGSDLVARQLFHPLVMQLAHWFSSPKMLESPRSGAFLEILWDGVTDESDPALRDLCATTIQEFVSWTIRQSSDRDLQKSPANIKAVIRQIKTYSVHPVLSKRIGAALVFNHMYQLLAAREELVDQFWLEATVFLVKNLALPGCHDHPAETALDFCQRGFHKHCGLFLRASTTKRRVPPELGSGLLPDVLHWLLLQCGSVTPACASKCRQMVHSLLSLVPGLSSLSDLSETEGVDIVDVCEGGGNGTPLPEDNRLRLKASLDCYVWALRNSMVVPATLTRTPSSLVPCVTHFIETVDLSDPKEDALEVLIVLFDLFSLLDSNINRLPATIWSHRFWTIVSYCVFEVKTGPSHLSEKLCTLLYTLRDHLSEGQLRELCEQMSMETKTGCRTCLIILENACEDFCIHPDFLYIRGLVLLHRTNLLLRVHKGSTWDGITLMTGVYSCLFNSDKVALHPRPIVLSYMRELLSFAILLGADVNVTVQSILDSSKVRVAHIGAIITKGEHLQVLLGESMLNHLLQDPSRAVTCLLRQPSLATAQVILQLLHMCKYSRTRVKRCWVPESVVKAVLDHWRPLELWAGSVSINKALLVELLKATVQTFPPSSAVGCLGRDPRYAPVTAWVYRQIAVEPLDQLVDLINLLPYVVVHHEADNELGSALRHVQTKFPVLCSELREGSAERNTFTAVFKTLLVTLVKSGSVVVLRTVSQAAADDKHACAQYISSALREFMRRHSEERQLEALREIFSKFLDETSDVETRLGVVERFLIPMVSEASKSAVTKFYAEKIQTIIDFLEETLKPNDLERRVKKQFVQKIGALQLIEPLFSRLDKTELEAVDNPIVCQAVTPQNTKLPKYFAATLFNLRKTGDCSSENLKQLMRRMQCCGYKAMMTFLCNTNMPENMFSAFLFKESCTPIWRKLVPEEPKYTFPVEFDDYPKMKKEMVQIRGLVKKSEATPTLTAYIPSQSLFSSSLQEDITRYDFSMYQVRDDDRLNQVLNEDQRAPVTSLDLEMDCLNDHECMATLCGVVKHLSDTFPLVLGQDGQAVLLPIWMENLRTSLTLSDQPDNCRAFIVRLIVNCQSYFKPTARFWLNPIVQTVIDGCLGSGLNYLIHDIVSMLTDWGPAAAPTDSTGQEKASEFLRRLVHHTPNERNAVFRYNVEVVKCVVSSWKSFVSVPYQELLDFVAQDPEPGHLLSDVFLSHGILPFNSAGKLSFYKSLLASLNPTTKPNIYKSCAIVIGKIFKVVSEGGTHPLTGEDLTFFKEVQEAINLKSTSRGFAEARSLELFIYCLFAIQENYPPIVNYDRFVTQCLSQVVSMSGIFQTKLIDILTSALDFEFRHEAFTLLHSDLPPLLGNTSNPDGQLAALKLVDKLMPSLTPTQMSEFMPSVASFLTHRRVDCRGVVYNIAKWMYDTYQQVDDSEALSLRKEARSFLLAGLADPDPQLQADLYSFMNDRLSQTVCGRLVDTLTQLYSPAHEETFLATATRLLLQVCELTNEYNENMFSFPLDSCAFEKYNVSGSWRTQHAVYVPMFANTLTSQISASLGSFNDVPFQLRATQSPASSLLVSVSNNNQEELSVYSFGAASASSASSLAGTSLSQLYKQGQSFGSDLLTPVDTTDGVQNSEGLRKIRFLKDKQKLSRKCAERNIVKAVHETKKLSEKMKRREGEVKLTRNYRKGDLPDIEIPTSGFIKALQSLAKRDQLIARQLLVAVCSKLEGEGHAQALSSALNNILQSSTSCHPALMATILELSLLKHEQCSTPTSVIARVSKKSHQLSLGALLVEAKLSCDMDSAGPPSAKRWRWNLPSQEHQDWIHLAEIYRSMEEKDVVQGLFEEKIADACAQTVRSALLAEDKCYWKSAQKLYIECIESEKRRRMERNDSKGNSIENFLYEACLKCVAYMSKWRDLNTNLKTEQLENRLDNVWAEDWTKDHFLSWLFQSEIICSQETSVLQLAEDFSTALTRWLGDSSRAAHIKEKLGEYLSVLLVVMGDVQRSKLTCESTLQRFLSGWQQLNTLSHTLRVHQLLQLGSLMDLHRFLSLPPNSDFRWASSVEALLNDWLETSPSPSESLMAWEKRVVYRNIFAIKLGQQTNMEPILEKLQHFQLVSNMKTTDFALEQKNFWVMRKFMKKARSCKLTKGYEHHETDKWHLAVSRGQLLRAQLELTPSAFKVQLILASWDGIQALKSKIVMDLLVSQGVYLHSADLYTTLMCLMKENPELAASLPSADRVRLSHLLDTNGSDVEQLEAKIVASLQEAVERSPHFSAEIIADTNLKLAHFCHQLDSSLYHDRLIESLLRAMKHGSSEARRLFPCLLQLPLLAHQQLFISESEKVPEWMFLGWVSQLLANLDLEWGCVLAPLLLRMAEAYPVALQFPFRLSKENYTNPSTAAIVDKLEQQLSLDCMTEALVRALGCICMPHLSLMYHIDKLKVALSQDIDAACKAYGQMRVEAFPPDRNEKVKGDIFKKVEKYSIQIEKLMDDLRNKKLLQGEVKRSLAKIRSDIYAEYNSNPKVKEDLLKPTQLAAFSPWLVSEYEGGIEVPGQYSGDSRPLPQHHLTIARFDRHVQPLDSLRVPCKVTVLGNDAKHHSYLVKFGEDLRQDQRLQQLFVLMTQLLRNSRTGYRTLSVDTYSVVPLNSRLGLIQWVDHTTVLNNFILTTKEKVDQFKNADGTFRSWWEGKKNLAKGDPSEFYKSFKRQESVSVLHKAESQVSKLMLRDAVWKLAASPEAFVYLRAEMVVSYGCMSVCHWLLGVGDRHLSNFLVQQDSGRLIGIDFGHAFGTATQFISVPELVPCRLTPQLVALASPLNTTGLLKESMVHSLQVMRDNRRVLLAAMSVFILEPSVDWLRAVHKQQELGNRTFSSDAQWYPQERIKEACRKLEGAHPRSITEKELEGGHAGKPYLGELLEILGDAYLESGMPEKDLNSRQQVECLIAQSTNEYILSVSFYGWMPWL